MSSSQTQINPSKATRDLRALVIFISFLACIILPGCAQNDAYPTEVSSSRVPPTKPQFATSEPTVKRPKTTPTRAPRPTQMIAPTSEPYPTPTSYPTSTPYPRAIPLPVPTAIPLPVPPTTPTPAPIPTATPVPIFDDHGDNIFSATVTELNPDFHYFAKFSVLQIRGELETPDDIDYFSFEAYGGEEGFLFSSRFLPFATDTGGGIPKIALYGAYSASWVTPLATNGISKDDISYTPGSPGIIYLAVSNSNPGYTGKYRLVVHRTSTIARPNFASPLEPFWPAGAATPAPPSRTAVPTPTSTSDSFVVDDHGTGRFSATDINLTVSNSIKIYGKIGHRGDVDTFSFRSSNGETFAFEAVYLLRGSVVTAIGHPKLILYNVSASTPLAIDDHGGNLFYITGGGTMYLDVSSRSTSLTSDYMISVYRVGP